MPLDISPSDKNFTQAVTGALKSEAALFLERYRAQNGLVTRWKEPLIGYAGADSRYIRELKSIISPTHCLPEDILPGPAVVICFFFAFERETAMDNIGGDRPSPLWAAAYSETNEMFLRLGDRLKEVIEGWGYRAAAPTDIARISAEKIYSNWSQRHLAYAAGLGTFGVNNMLITENGCCGRFFSLVSDLPAAPGKPLERENCAYKREGRCGACAKRCPAGALSPGGEFDRGACFKRVCENAESCGSKICGKCTVGLPCTFRPA